MLKGVIYWISARFVPQLVKSKLHRALQGQDTRILDIKKQRLFVLFTESFPISAKETIYHIFLVYRFNRCWTRKRKDCKSLRTSTSKDRCLCTILYSYWRHTLTYVGPNKLWIFSALEATWVQGKTDTRCWLAATARAAVANNWIDDSQSLEDDCSWAHVPASLLK